jgi:tetratricopeptide (TPR) repeat protein
MILLLLGLLFQDDFENGLAALQARRYEAARESFQKVVAAQPANRDAWRLLACAFNGLGRFEEALAAADRAGSRYEAARAKLHLGRAAEALDTLRLQARLHPDDAEAQYEYAVALHDTGAWAEALAPLERARTLDGSRALACRYMEGLCLLRSGDTTGASKALNQAIEIGPHSQLATSARQILRTLVLRALIQSRREPVPAGKRWWARATWAWETVDNVPLLADDVSPLPAEISHRSDQRLAMSVDAGAVLVQEGPLWAGLRMDGSAAWHRRLDDFDLFTARIAAFGLYREEPWEAGLELSYGHTWFDRDPFVDAYTVRAHGQRSLSDATFVRLDAAFTQAEYRNRPPTPFEDRDGPIAGMSATGGWTIAETRTALTLGGLFSSNDTQGGSYENDAVGFFAGVRQGVWGDLVVSARVQYRRVEFREKNLRANFATERRDDEWSWGIRIEKGFVRHLSVFAEYREYRNESNIDAVFSYEQRVFAAGVMLAW